MNKSLAIALVVDKIEIGGVETFLFRLQRYFKEAGHHVTLVCCARKGAWWDKAESLGIKCVCLSMPGLSTTASHATRIGKYLASQFYDCILLNHSVYAQASLSLLPEHVIAIPIIHNDYDSVYAIACSNSEAWNVAIGVSPKVTQTAKRLLPNKPIETVFYGVPSPTIEEFNNRPKMNGKIKLLFVGQLNHWHKGVYYLPEIIKKCRYQNIDVSLSIIGSGTDINDLGSRIEKAGIAEYVTLRGVLPPDHIYREMLNHHVLLMPSHFEGLPIVSLEAQACGCVPIASRLPGITDQAIDDAHTGMLANIGDIDAFVKCIDTLYRNPMLWRAMSENGHSRIKNEFSVEIMGEAYLNIIRKALVGKYPLQIERKMNLKIDNHLFTWRDYIPCGALKIIRILLARLKLLQAIRNSRRSRSI